MKFRIEKNTLRRNLRDVLRRAGYFSILDSRSNQTSFVRRLSRSQHYPRFHLYIDDLDNFYQFNLHLDQKKVSYQGAKAHSADYEDPIVTEEANRLQSQILN